MTNKLLCIFHSNTTGHCDDGFAAAWAVRAALGEDNVEFFPGVYGKPPPDVTGRDVVLVDFSYKRPVIDEIIEKASSLLILDHHKTAMADLSGFPPAGVSWHEWRQTLGSVVQHPAYPKRAFVGVLFDMERSGARIALDFFHNLAHQGAVIDGGVDLFFDYIQDRDLWRKHLPEGDEFTIALRSYEQDFGIWDVLIDRGVGRLIEEGRILQRYYRQRVEEIKRSGYFAAIGAPGPFAVGDRASIWHCHIANAPYFAASEVAGELAEMLGAQFGACYFEVRPGEWQYSLRSRGDFDVSEVAKLFGGGGHAGAAGFTVKAPVHVPVVP